MDASRLALLVSILLLASVPDLAAASPPSAFTAPQAPISTSPQQESQPPPDADEPAGEGEEQAGEQAESQAVESDAERGLVVPDVDVFLPDGELDLRLNRLIEKVFFEGQVKYDFVDGDIAAFLRYRYYGYRRTYQLSVFDTVEFESLERLSDEFERVRGTLFLVQWPQSFHRRAFFLAQVDDIFSNRPELARDSGRTNTFVRLGYQLGTPDDSRSNAIVGETRAQVRRLFTPYRTIGPGDAGFTAALTWGFDFTGGDFDYSKLEIEGLKRFELTRDVFLIGRIHGGTFLHKAPDPEASERDLPRDRVLVPLSELFRLDGRDNLRGLDERLRGTEELHTTWELLLPWFTDENRSFLKADWKTFYWVLYAGYGTVGFDREVFRELGDYVKDVGIGFQSSFQVRDYTLFLSALAAQALDRDGDIKLRVSFKSYH